MSVFSGVRDRDMIIPWEIEEIRTKHIQILRKKNLEKFYMIKFWKSAKSSAGGSRTEKAIWNGVCGNGIFFSNFFTIFLFF